MKQPYSTGILLAKIARSTVPFGAVMAALVALVQSFGVISEEQGAAVIGLATALTALVAAFTAHKDLEGYENQ